MRGKTFLGSVLDPIWLWPVESRVDKDILMGDLKTCDVHMHNLKSIKLTNVQVLDCEYVFEKRKGLKMRFQQVYRNADLSRSAARLFFHFPILWLTGSYSLTNSKVFRFIPSKDREGAKERKGGRSSRS